MNQWLSRMGLSPIKYGGMTVLVAIAILLLGQWHPLVSTQPALSQAVSPTSPQTSPRPATSPPPSLTLPSSSAPGVAPPGTPQPGVSPASTPSVGTPPLGTPSATPSPTPSSPIPTFVPPPAQFPPAATAPALPVEAKPYSDPVGRFQVGIRQGYKTSPLAGTVLVEAPDGNLAYTVVAQAQPNDSPLSSTPSFANTEVLGKIATTVFQRGEGFQPGPPQPESGGGVVINWSGSLTIAGKSQPTGGVILVRPTDKYILLALVAATEAGASQVQGTVAAIADSLKSL